MTNQSHFTMRRNCTLLGHSWHEVPSDWVSHLGGLQMTLRCERCDLERRDTMSQTTGDLMSRRYTYPKGYLFSKTDPRPTRNEFRLDLLREKAALQRRQRRQARSAA